ncbi:uncharacterized protein RAG0_03180 [Rhynchosporium agropyri]|uniref:GED domain-containing protein n=1 Tax=Rhynchosporium agropyri TaxID=914238 RepID=A0A1E1K3H7_9HELO|nr:uncharacterized protein RAG0_03180 [Rhynchosporium agropyri]
MASANSKRFIKRESTVARGLPTPAPSIKSFRTESPSIKFENSEIDRIDLTGDDEIEDLPPSNHDLPVAIDEQEQSRSPGIPSRSSRLPSTPTPRAPKHPRQTHPPRMESGLEVVGRNVKKLVETIEKLKRIGLKSIDAQLPELVLVGDQSAGKSSLMGAIAEINLPKGQSMCTRCPTNIRTSSSETWTCIITLEISYSFQAHKGRAQEKFPHWAENDESVIVSFMEITDKTELEQALRCAQKAILNPSSDPQCFISRNGFDPSQATESDEARFSPNVIAVAIAGPGLPDLSFYDLPGLFQAAEAEEQKYLIKVFDNLTAKYIKHENAIIICAMTMQNDPGISKTKGFVGNLKADNRCIGVLTMPDRIQQNETVAHQDYTKILANTAFVLQPHGYFVTKQPGPDSLAKGPRYHEIARQEENDFFESSGVWGPGGEWHQFRHRCGTATIQEYLSKVFARQILLSLPDITENINVQIRDVDRGLANLPDARQDKVQHVVRQALNAFSNQVRQSIDPTLLSPFHSEWNKLCGQFLKTLDTMRPGCICKGGEPEVIELDSDDEGSQYSTVKRPNDGAEVSPNKRARNTFVEPSQVPQTPRTVKPEPGTKLFRTPLPGVLRKYKQSEFGPFYQAYLGAGFGAMSLMELRATIADNACAGRPTETNFKVKQEIALRAIAKWWDPIETLMKTVFARVRRKLLSTLETCLAKYTQTALFADSKVIIEKWLHDKDQEQWNQTLRYFEVESSRLFTICLKEFERHKAEALELLMENRKKQRIDSYIASHSMKYKEESKARAEAEAQLGPDTFAEELRTAAYIRGYYHTARIRFTDSICADINAHYYFKISEEIQYLLENKLKLDEGDSEFKCQALVEENADISHQRTSLLKRKQQLSEFSAILTQLNTDLNTSGEDDPMQPPQNGFGNSNANDHDHDEMDLDNPSGATSTTVSPTKSYGYGQ